MEPKRQEITAAHSRVLIVDDDPGMCDTLEVLLSPTYQCSVAASLSEARKRLSDNGNFSVVLLDLNLPDGSGDTLLGEIKGGFTQVIVLTMISDVRRAAKLMSEGAFYYLTKDAPGDEILKTVAQANQHALEEKRAATVETQLKDLSMQLSSLKESIWEELWHFSQAADLSKVLRPNAELRETIDAFEKRHLLASLEKHGWRRHVTAKALGVHINTLLLKMKRYGLSKSRKGGPRETGEPEK